MKKFVTHHSKGTVRVVEVECEDVICHPWEIKDGETRYRILSPIVLFDNGRSPVWYSWAFYDSQALAFNVAAGEIRAGMERQCAKAGILFDNELFLAKVAAIETILIGEKNGQRK